MEEPHLGEHIMAGDEVACVLCQDIMFTSPVSLQCGHYFCWECIHAYTENLSEAKECPTCGDIMISCHTVYPPGPQGVPNPETPSRPERGEVRLIGQMRGRSRSPSPHITPPPSPQQDALGAAQNGMRGVEVFDFIGDGLDDDNDLHRSLDRGNGLQEEEWEEGENGGGGVPAQRRKFWDGSLVPGSTLTHKQVIASYTRRHMEEEKVCLNDVVWRTLFRQIRQTYPLSFCANTIPRTGGTLIKRSVDRSLKWHKRCQEGEEEVGNADEEFLADLRAIDALDESTPAQRTNGRGRPRSLPVNLSRQRLTEENATNDLGLSQPSTELAQVARRERSNARVVGEQRRDQGLLRLNTSHMVRSGPSRRSNPWNDTDTFNQLLRDRDDRRESLRQEVEERRKEEKEREEERRRDDRQIEWERYERLRRDEREKEELRRMDEKEREECRRKDEKERDRIQLQMIAMLSGGRVNVPVNPRVIISSSLPSAPAVQIKIESLPQLIRELRRLFDSSGKEILVKQDGMEILLTDCDIDWPSKLQLSMAERELSGVMTQVFVLDPL